MCLLSECHCDSVCVHVCVFSVSIMCLHVCVCLYGFVCLCVRRYVCVYVQCVYDILIVL